MAASFSAMIFRKCGQSHDIVFGATVTLHQSQPASFQLFGRMETYLESLSIPTTLGFYSLPVTSLTGCLPNGNECNYVQEYVHIFAPLTCLALIRSKLSEINDPKRLKKTIVVLELPFVADDTDMKRYFSKCKGGVKSIDM
jgi:hypothetical protein